jgi:hypothetical protein
MTAADFADRGRLVLIEEYLVTVFKYWQCCGWPLEQRSPYFRVGRKVPKGALASQICFWDLTAVARKLLTAIELDAQACSPSHCWREPSFTQPILASAHALQLDRIIKRAPFLKNRREKS